MLLWVFALLVLFLWGDLSVMFDFGFVGCVFDVGLVFAGGALRFLFVENCLQGL